MRDGWKQIAMSRKKGGIRDEIFYERAEPRKKSNKKQTTVPDIAYEVLM